MMISKLQLFILILLVFSKICISATLRVGPAQQLKTPSAAAKIAKDGDTIEIQAATYKGDSTVWRQNNLIIRAVNGRAHMVGEGRLAEAKAIWVIKGNNTIVVNIEFSNARVEDRNGAGIRQEGAGLTIKNCYFHHNENGILTNHNPLSDIIIESSEFFANGYGDGYSHNIYVGEIRSLTIQFSYSHGAIIGHQIKSRAQTNRILYNRLMDEANGTSSYIIDLPNGGLSQIIGNLIQQGPNTENSTLLSYGAEGSLHNNSRLLLAHNTFVNDRHAGVFLSISTQTNNHIVANNIFAGRGSTQGEANFINNLKTTKPGFIAANQYNYRLTKQSLAIDSGSNIGQFGSIDLTPIYHYKHPLSAEPRLRNGKFDIGAYEFNSTVAQ